MPASSAPTHSGPPRRRRSDGERSREAILNEAAQLATVEGIDGLSIARLAGAVGMSKSGLFAHFGSKQDLQLETIAMADAVFNEQVIEPASSAPTGIERLRRLTALFLRHIEDDVFTGGCFFASVAAEMDTRPGPVRDAVVRVVDDWMKGLESAVRDAQTELAIDAGEDPEQLAFELDAYLLLANAQFVASHQSIPIERASRAIERRLTSAAGLEFS